ncbi:MAG TPA: 50S ribosomal protein L30e [Euryarchaeota archaeon]|nr:50S ribosomal protein L30e [archaeon BMS3Bbin15]HDL16037.1 50S ribosomal protein L30e [Euryarchaeota archaeon]
MDINKAIRVAIDTGKVYMGSEETLNAFINGKIKLAIVADNCLADKKADLKKFANLNKIPVFEFKGTSMELGAICGRPHVVAMLGIVESGDSDIFELGRRKE